MKISQKLFNDFHKIFNSHSKGAPACAEESKSYDWDVRNVAKISPKMDKKSFFDLFLFSQKQFSMPYEISCLDEYVSHQKTSAKNQIDWFDPLWQAAAPKNPE